MTNAVRQTLFGLACCGFLVSSRRDPDDELAAAIRARDAQFWAAYNACDFTNVEQLFTADVEFYHDKSGPLMGRDALLQTLKTNLCGNRAWHLRRAPVPGTEMIFPLRKGKEIYGAILSGEHLFYITEAGKKEYLDGRARYTHLWLKQAGELRMARILSFNHRPPSDTLSRKH